MDDTFVIVHTDMVDHLLGQLGWVFPSNTFTIEIEIESKLAFLDVEVHYKPDGSLRTSVYGKPTHTSRLLDFNSCNPISHKCCVVRTLAAQAWTLSSSKAVAIKQIRLVGGVLLKNGYNEGILPTLEEPKRTERKEPDMLWHCVLPYYPDLSEGIGRIVRGTWIDVAYKPLHNIHG